MSQLSRTSFIGGGFAAVWLGLGACEALAAPANDGFANPLALSGGQFTLDVDCTDASREPGEPEGLERTVWYEWTAPHGGLVTLSTSVPAGKPTPTMTTLEAAFAPPAYDNPDGWPPGVVIPILPPPGSGGSYGVTITAIGGISFPPLPPFGPEFIPGFAVYRGERVEALTLVASDDGQEALTFKATGGESYRIAFGSRTITPGKATLHLLLTYPQNDDFNARLPLVGVKVNATGHLLGATREANEPRHAVGALGASAWWSWRAPEDAVVGLTLTPTDFQGVLALYTGDALDNLTLVGSNTNAPIAQLTRAVPGGQTLAIAVDTVAGTPGDYALDLTAVPAPPSLDRIRRGPSGADRPLLDAGHLRGRKFAVDVSDNMRSWTTIFVGIANANQATLEDFTTAGWTTRFYRVRLADDAEAITSYPPRL